MITNPVIPGFHPDPSICRVDDVYYIASSTFHWWPGVRLHQSRDLNSWKPVGYAIERPGQLDLVGTEDHGGIWAPCLSFCDGLFYLIYTDVKSWTGAYKDAHNYMITAPSVSGPWSEPVYLNSSGFDPSLFHDDDGTKWVLNMLWDHRPRKNPFAGIVLQEFDSAEACLVGAPRVVFKGSGLGLVEGPHVYKKDGWYYLLTAEGGTSWDHAATVARARDIAGPYDIMPENPLLTSKHDTMLPLQRAGHGSFVEAPTGDWYFAHLTGRPVLPERRCTLGRETAIQALEWDEAGWPRIKGGGNSPRVHVETPGILACPYDADARTVTYFDGFDEPILEGGFNTLREPADASWLSLTARRGWLRLRGRESLFSTHHQSLVARRINHFDMVATTEMSFSPVDFQQMAGLVFYYDTRNYHYLFASATETGTVVGILTGEGGNVMSYPGVDVQVNWDTLLLRGGMRDGVLRFYFAPQGDAWQSIGPPLDATVLSDEYKSHGKFTGAFVGLCVQDLGGRGCVADFDWFSVDAGGPDEVSAQATCQRTVD